MTCDEYLARLSTASLDEIEAENAYGHPADCPDCGRISRLVAERERDRIDAFDELYASTPMRTDGGALPDAPRARGVGTWFSMVGAAALLTLVWFGVMRLTVGGRTTETRVATSEAATSFTEEAFTIRCLTGHQAAELVRPHLGLRGNRVTYSPTREPGILRVVATAEQFDVVRPVIFKHEIAASASCPATP